MKYKILEGIATADVAYEVYGKSMKRLFAHAAEAVEQTMVDLATVKELEESKIKIRAPSLDILLLDFLNELLFLKDSENKVYSNFNILIYNQLAEGDHKTKTGYVLISALKGEKIDPRRHKLRCDVKAVTRHNFEIKKSHGYYIATIVLDI